MGRSRFLRAFDCLVAWLFFGFVILTAYTFDFVLRCVHVPVRDEHDADVVALLYVRDNLAFLVEQVSRDLDRQLCHHPAGAFLERLLFDDAQNRQRK